MSVPEPAPREAGARWYLVLFLGWFGFFGLTAHGYLENTDAEMTLHAARAFYLRGDFGLVADAADSSVAEVAIASNHRNGMTGVNGKHYLWFPIGHQLLMVPCVALGELFARWFPEPERIYAELKGPLFGRFYWARFFASWLPTLAAAGSAVMILLLALALGSSRREALLVMAVTVLCTQLWPGASETMSDGPGLFLLLVMTVAVVRYHTGRGGGPALLWGGLCGGFGVLVRYPDASGVVLLGLLAVWAAWRRRRLADLPWLLAGALPAAVALLAANWLRFGSLTETGYSQGANARWFGFSPWLGIPCMLLAPGKGMLWFSPPLWIAAAGLLRREARRLTVLVLVVIAVIPIAVYGHTSGWGAGQCWAIRYVTPSVVLLVAAGLAIGRPWRRHPRLFAALCLAGLVVSLGGVLTPYRGQVMFATAAAKVEYPEGLAHIHLQVDCDPRFSPLHSDWTYVWLSATGRLERGGSANTTEPMFGVEVSHVPPPQPEDVGFRHLWWVLGGALFAWPAAWIAVCWTSLTALLLGVAVRRVAGPPAP